MWTTLTVFNFVDKSYDLRLDTLFSHPSLCPSEPGTPLLLLSIQKLALCSTLQAFSYRNIETAVLTATEFDLFQTTGNCIKAVPEKLTLVH